MLATHIEPEMLKPNYMALRLCIINENITVDRSVEVLVSIFPAGDRQKPCPVAKFSETDLMNMKKQLEKGKTYNQVAKKYGLKRGDNVYQMLRRTGMLPDRKKKKG